MLGSIDPRSPVPAFHQIAEGVRYRLAVGELAPGDPLPAVRAAADRLGVHYHTVRRAYAELEAEGFVRSERGRGTWIRESAVASRPGGATRTVGAAPEAPAGLLRFLERVEMEARAAHDLGAEALGRLILARAQGSAGALYVVECNGPQARDYAGQIRSATGAETRPWLLSEGEPPAGPVVAPYFHLRDVRARWPDRAEAVRYLTTELDPALEVRLAPLAAEGVRRVVVHDPRADRVHHVLEDVRQRLAGSGLDVGAGGLADAGALLREAAPPVAVLFTPRTWSGLPAAIRAHPRAVRLRYLIRADDLEALGDLVRARPGTPTRAAAT